MKSYLFTTDDDRGGVILCDIDTLEEVVPYLQRRFKGVIRVEQGRTEWTVEGGFAEFTPRPVSVVGLEDEEAVSGGSLSAEAEGASQAEGSSQAKGSSKAEGSSQADGSSQARGTSQATGSLEAEGSKEMVERGAPEQADDSPTGSLF